MRESGCRWNDPDKGLIWLSWPVQGDSTIYEVGQEVIVWIEGGVLESSPAQAKHYILKF
uniref:DUF3221 domain-containing protein n=1 Tax=Sporosarcina sp. FSL K6-1522 TaxID=2921554 RepID=UPI00406C45A0